MPTAAVRARRRYDDEVMTEVVSISFRFAPYHGQTRITFILDLPADLKVMKDLTPTIKRHQYYLPSITVLKRVNEMQICKKRAIPHV